VRFEETEVRTSIDYPEAFPLYPYEEIAQEQKQFIQLKDMEALLLKATRPFLDSRGDKLERFVDDEYLFKGPGTYIPRVDEEVVSRLEALIVLQNNALLVRAKKDTKDSDGILRKAGEQWLHRKQGYFMPSAEQEVTDVRQGYVLNDSLALNLRADQAFTDFYGNKRLAGDVYIIDKAISPVHIVDAYEELVQ
jgi:major vault protein